MTLTVHPSQEEAMLRLLDCLDQWAAETSGLWIGGNPKPGYRAQVDLKQDGKTTTWTGEGASPSSAILDLVNRKPE